MSDSNEEPYATIFASLKHPIRRKILRMLSKKPMSFSEMLEALKVSSSFLNYHLENLGELILKTNDGTYKLSTFGEAALATMTKVEDIPEMVHQQFTDPTKAVRRTTAIALGIICIVLIASLGGAFAFYNSAIMNKDNIIVSKDNQIASLSTQLSNQNNTNSYLNSQISQLSSNVTSLQEQAASDNSTINSLQANLTNLQDQQNELLSGNTTLLELIMNNPSAWVNTTVVVQGTLTEYSFPSNGLMIGIHDVPLPDTIPPPWNYWLSSTNGIDNIGILWNGTEASPNYSQVQICGVVRQGIEENFYGTNTTVFYIEALTVDWSSPLQSVFFLFNLQPTLFFSDLQEAYGSRVNNSSLQSTRNADLNKDGIIDLKDLVLFARTSPLLLNISATTYSDRDGASWTNVTLFVENASQCILTYAKQGSLDGTVVVNATGNETMLRTGNQYSATFDCNGYGSSMLQFNTEVYVLDKQGQSTLVASYTWSWQTGPFLP